jgi:hypothetical protein
MSGCCDETPQIACRPGGSGYVKVHEPGCDWLPLSRVGAIRSTNANRLYQLTAPGESSRKRTLKSHQLAATGCLLPAARVRVLSLHRSTVTCVPADLVTLATLNISHCRTVDCLPASSAASVVALTARASTPACQGGLSCLETLDISQCEHLSEDCLPASAALVTLTATNSAPACRHAHARQ